MKIGILSVQGDYDAHCQMLQRLNTQVVNIYHPWQLSTVQGLILPGGESTTMLKFLQQDNFLAAIQEFASAGGYLFGTCAGAILLAKEVKNPQQVSLNLLDVTITRNAYGRQLASHIGWGQILQSSQKIEMVFIRAPQISDLGPDVDVFATYGGAPVGVKQGRVMITTFHPELTANHTIHEMFITQIKP